VHQANQSGGSVALAAVVTKAMEPVVQRLERLEKNAGLA
jgi:hypothetical protein